MLSALLAAPLALLRTWLERKRKLQAAQFLQRHLLPRMSLLAWAPVEQSTWCRPSSIMQWSKSAVSCSGGMADCANTGCLLTGEL